MILQILFTWTNLFVLCLGILLGVIMQIRWSSSNRSGGSLPTRNVWYCHLLGARIIIQDYLNRYEEEYAFTIAQRMCRQINIYVQGEGYPFGLVIIQESYKDLMARTVRIQEIRTFGEQVSKDLPKKGKP